jgi:hypothetical protein
LYLDMRRHVPTNPSYSHVFQRQGICVERTLRTEELSRDVQGLSSNNNDLLAVEQLLSNGTGQPTKEVALAIDRNLCDFSVSTLCPYTVQFSRLPSKSLCVEARETSSFLVPRLGVDNLRLVGIHSSCPAHSGNEEPNVEKVW